MIPDWLQRYLIGIGRWDTDGVRRAVSATMCRCGRRVLRALDDDIAAHTVTVDPAPLDAAGELQALISGRKTYRLTYRRDHWELDRRWDIDIAAQSPSVVHVLVSHECGKPIVGNGPSITNPRLRTLQFAEVPF